MVLFLGTSLPRNFFTDFIRGHAEAAVCKLKKAICKRLFSSFFIIKKRLGEGTSIPRLKATLLFSLTCSVDFFMLSPHNKPAFVALIPPFTSLNPIVTFFKPLQPHSSSHNWGYMRIPGSTPTLPVIYRKYSHAKQAVHMHEIKSSSRLWVSEANFHKELSRITFYDYIIYPKL